MPRFSKPRILFIAVFPPPIHGSSVVSEQIRNSKVINDAFDGDYVNLGTSRKMDEIGKGGLWLNMQKLFRFAGSFFKTFGLLLSHRYDLCYCAITCHGSGFLKDAPFVLLCKLFGRKVIIHQHNKGMAKDVDRPIYRWLLPLVYKNAKVILLSWHLYPDIEKVVKRENVMICPNGIKPTVNPDFQRTHNNIPHILFLSNLLIDKGVLVLLDALKILKDKGYSFVCDFVGSETKDIDAARFAKEVEKRGLNRLAIYHGRKYGEEKEAYFKQTEAFVLPSFNEAFPLVNIEAMEYKLPIVSTNVGGIPDEVVNGENGYIIKDQDSQSLADALCKLLGDESLRQKLGETGYQKFKAKFTEMCFEEQLASTLKTAIGGGKITLVNYWGRRYGGEKDVFWKDADIFVFPTLNETFGLVAVEAMEYVIPVVASAEGGIQDIIENGNSGYTVEKNNPMVLASAIELLIKDPELCISMGKAGRKLFEEKFTEEVFEKRMKECLEKAIVN